MVNTSRIKKYLPNVITIFRIILAPFVVILLLNPSLSSVILSLLIFVISAISDALDGYLARKYSAKTKFGFIVDPIADKIIVISVYTVFAFIEVLRIPIVFVLIIVLRDILVIILKPISDNLGFPIKTTFFAKTKTTIQFISILVLYFYYIWVIFTFGNTSFDRLESAIGKWIYIPYGTVLITTLITIISGLEYIYLFIKSYQQLKRNHD